MFSDYVVQIVIDWCIDVDCDVWLCIGFDGYGNLIMMFYIDGLIEVLELIVCGEVLMEDQVGVIKGVYELLLLFYFMWIMLLMIVCDIICDFVQMMCGSDWLECIYMLNMMVGGVIKIGVGCGFVGWIFGEIFDSGYGIICDVVYLLVVVVCVSGCFQ